MKPFRYQLEKYSGMKTRHICPSCGKKNVFALYVDMETQDMIASNVGRCERLDNCGYHYTPKQYFSDNGITRTFETYTPPVRTVEIQTPSFIDAEIFKRSLRCYASNNLVTFLNSTFDTVTVNQILSTYPIGTCKNGATIFWQVDTVGKIRTGKIILYNPVTGKRDKNTIPNWAHKRINTTDFNLRQCLFGEHLLNSTDKPIAVVESEKTAVIASVYLPQFTWTACGGKEMLSHKICKSLTGRKVILYPDLNGFEKWSKKAKEFNFAISDLLEKKATDQERESGLDIADYLIKLRIK